VLFQLNKSIETKKSPHKHAGFSFHMAPRDRLELPT
jgi:hypothetical protein